MALPQCSTHSHPAPEKSDIASVKKKELQFDQERKWTEGRHKPEGRAARPESTQAFYDQHAEKIDFHVYADRHLVCIPGVQAFYDPEG